MADNVADYIAHIDNVADIKNVADNVAHNVVDNVADNVTDIVACVAVALEDQ